MLPKLNFIHNRKKVDKNVPSVIELQISAGKVRKYISTGIKILPKEWSKGSVVGREDWKTLNDELSVIKKKCSDIILSMLEDGALDVCAIPKLLKDSLLQQDTFIDFCKQVAEQKCKVVRKGTRQHYKLLLSFLEEWKGLIYFSDITEKNIIKMDNELASRGLQVASRWNYHKRIKMFIDKAIDDGLVKKNPYKNLDLKKQDNENVLLRLLSPDEFHRFENCEIEDSRLSRVRDLFVFQTYTMMGYSDLAAFQYEKCTEDSGHVVYKSYRVKTGKRFVVVLSDMALAILKKYNYKLPIISNVKYNKYVKDAAKCAGIDINLTTHFARHTGATLALNEGGVPMHIVQHVLGHASIRETERTYAKVLDSSIIETMASYQDGTKNLAHRTNPTSEVKRRWRSV